MTALLQQPTHFPKRKNDNPGLIQLTQFIPQPPAKVWVALTDPVLHAKWWDAEGNITVRSFFAAKIGWIPF